MGKKKTETEDDALEQATMLDRTLDLTTRLAGMAPVNMNSLQDIEDRITEYFDTCKEFCVAPDVAGLSLALGIKRKEFLQLVESGANDPRVVVLSRSHQRINAILSALSKKAYVNPTMAIMDLANDFGYSRQGDVVIEKRKEDIQQSAEQIAMKYAGLLSNTTIVDAEVVKKDAPSEEASEQG